MIRRVVFLVLALCSAACSSRSTLPAVSPQNAAAPHVQQPGGQPGWAEFQLPVAVYGFVAGNDLAIWNSVSQIGGQRQNALVRIDMSGGVTTFAPPSGWTIQTPLAPNPDGNMYVAATNLSNNTAILQLSPSHHWAVFPLPAGVSTNTLVSASDGNLWMAVVDNGTGHPAYMTPHGVYKEFSGPLPAYITCLKRGSDKNLWATYSTELLRITVADGTITAFTHPYPTLVACLVPGADGGLWTRSNHEVNRFDTNGNLVQYAVQWSDGGSYVMASGPNKSLYWSQKNHIRVFSEISHSMSPSIAQAPGEQFDVGLYLGPDGQLWTFDSDNNFSNTLYVYIVRPIITTPTQVTVHPGSSESLTVVEKNSPVKKFTAVSQNTTIATVSGSGHDFSVTGVAPGFTTILISDSFGNSLFVGVTVN